ncbi:hypothetical protein [Photorhabdus hainanensis]|uniref:hypothetical protein n=1 Tax=Photorhabdus hainanensis TaxID=1004166 RepID=UPI001FE30C6E|nr:hypothetical protein [Photorhabdus hainanensis]
MSCKYSIAIVISCAPLNPQNHLSAPATLLHSTSGIPHAQISAAQRTRRAMPGGWDKTLKEELHTSYREMIDAGVPQTQARKALGDAYKYFDKLRGANKNNPFFDI